jgi:hypothetical protein
MDLSHQPEVLYRASIERMAAAWRALDDADDYPLASYLAGLAVECILQALAFKIGAAHDAGHALPKWLSKCPRDLQNSIKSQVRDDWSLLVALWDNGIRYLSRHGFLGYLRDKGRAVGIRGGPESVLRMNTKALVKSADALHKKGLAQWVSFTKK